MNDMAYLDELTDRYPSLEPVKESIRESYEILKECFSSGHKLLVAGNGGSAADSLASSGLFAGRDCRLLKLAEQTGSLPDTLEDLAVRQEEAGLRRLDQMVGAIEPAIVVVTSALAGVILLSVMLPLMGLLSTIG